MLKKIILALLARISKFVISKHKPFVIGITGTVGKTTTTNFTYEFLKKMFGDPVYMSPYDYNGEFGLPLTILQSKSPNKNFFGRIIVFIKGIYLYFSKNYPSYLVLEYGIDHKGEMEFLTDIVSPDIGIVLNISPNHVSQFPEYKDYINEKVLLGIKSKKVIYNSDDQNLKIAFSKINDSFSFSVNSDSDLKAFDIKSNIESLIFSIKDKDNHNIDLVYYLLGDHQVYNILPVFLLGKLLGINLEKIKEILVDINPQKGRGTILKGVNDSIIIDGSYNGGFLSITSGVNFIKNIKGDYNKILFLGEMRELGTESKKIHIELSNLLSLGGYNSIVLVGDEMKKYVFDNLFSNGIEVFYYKSSKDAGEKIREIIKSNSNRSVVYVKGSQNTIFLEEGIKKFLFDSKDFNKLCRQSTTWLRKKEDFFSHIL